MKCLGCDTHRRPLPSSCRGYDTQIDTAIGFPHGQDPIGRTNFLAWHVQSGFVAVSQMPRRCVICLKSTTHVHPDNDHEGNSP